MSGGLIIIINWLSDTKSCQSVRRWWAAQRHSPETKLLDWCNAISRSSCTAFWFLEFILDVKQRIVIVCRHQKIQTFSKFPVFMFEKKGPGTKNMPKELHVHCWKKKHQTWRFHGAKTSFSGRFRLYLSKYIMHGSAKIRCPFRLHYDICYCNSNSLWQMVDRGNKENSGGGPM